MRYYLSRNTSYEKLKFKSHSAGSKKYDDKIKITALPI